MNVPERRQHHRAVTFVRYVIGARELDRSAAVPLEKIDPAGCCVENAVRVPAASFIRAFPSLMAQPYFLDTKSRPPGHGVPAKRYLAAAGTPAPRPGWGSFRGSLTRNQAT